MQKRSAAEAALAAEIEEKRRRIAQLETPGGETAFCGELVKHLLDGFSLLDADGVHLDVNPALCEMTGFSRDELVGAGPPHPYWPPEEDAAIQAAFRKTLVGRTETFPLTFMRKNGERFPVLVTPSVLRDADGEVVAAFATVKDMTALSEAEAALAESERLFRLTFDQAPIGAALVGIDFRFLRVNARFARMMGYSMDELLERGFPDITHPDDVAADVAQVKRLAAGEIDVYARQKRYMRKDGSMVWGDVVVRPVAGEDGLTLAFVAMVADITARREAEAALQASEARYRLLLQNQNDAVYVHEITPDGPGAFVEVNDQACEMLGYARDELLAMEIAAIDVPEQAERLPAIMRRLYETGAAVFTTEHLAKDGRRIPVEVSARLFELEGRTTVLSVVRDVSDRVAAEAAIAKAQQLLNETQDISRLGGWEYDVATGRITWTEQLYRLHGVDPSFDPNDLRRNIDFYVSEDQAVIDTAFARILETGAPYDLELRFRPLGSDRPIWVRTTARAEMRDGSVTRVVGNLVDIDERKVVEQALAAERERARTYLDLAGVMIVAVRADGVVTVANRKACQVLGRTESEVVGRDWFDLALPDDVGQVVREVFDGLMRGETEAREYFENDIVTATGERRLIAWHNILLRDTDGAATGTLSSGEDITERRAMEDALRESEAKYREVVDRAADGIVIADEARLLFANDAFARMSGHAGEDLAGTPYLDFVPEDQRAGIADRVRRRLAGEDVPARYEIELLRKDGSRFGAEVSAGVISVAGAPRDLVLLHDITERRAAEQEIRRLNQELRERIVSRTEQLEAATHELEALAYSMAHDVRAPLRTIDGFSALVVQDEAERLSPEGAAHLQRVRAAAQTLARLMDELMGLSRLGRRELLREAVDLSALAREVGAEEAAEHPGRDVTLLIAPGLHAEADARLVRIILRELLGNAWKFTAPHETAAVEVGAADVGGELAFYVRDDGVGFDMHYAQHLFGAFQRMHPAGRFEGDGIGLATVQRLVRRHGGRVWAEAAVGSGAAVFFTLPPPVER